MQVRILTRAVHLFYVKLILFISSRAMWRITVLRDHNIIIPSITRVVPISENVYNPNTFLEKILFYHVNNRHTYLPDTIHCKKTKCLNVINNDFLTLLLSNYPISYIFFLTSYTSYVLKL